MDEQTNKIMEVVTTYFKVIEGRVKTTIEASVPGDRQAEAAKSIGAQAIWSCWDDVKREVRRVLEEEKEQ